MGMFKENNKMALKETEELKKELEELRTVVARQSRTLSDMSSLVGTLNMKVADLEGSNKLLRQWKTEQDQSQSRSGASTSRY